MNSTNSIYYPQWYRVFFLETACVSIVFKEHVYFVAGACFSILLKQNVLVYSQLSIFRTVKGPTNLFKTSRI